MEAVNDKILANKENHIGWIVFNNPARHNAMSVEMWQALPRMLDDYARDPEVRVVVLKGAGDKAFVAGADISKFKDQRSSAEAVRAYNAAVDAAYKAVQNCAKPTIAMIRGYCIGGGTGIAIGCDIRIAAQDARFAVPAAKLGLGYGFDGIHRLVNIVGPAFATEIFYTARQFTAQEALQMNLINRMVPVDELETYTRGYADTIAANAPLTIATVKRTVIESLKDPALRDLAACEQMVTTCFASDDYKEGQTAFMEKRRPVFRGR